MLKCAGAFHVRSTMQRKPWLNLDEQVALLDRRGLVMRDPDHCRQILRRVSYYHLSGYARFFQKAPTYGDNDFRPGTTLEQIVVLQDLDEQLRHLCLQNLSTVESALRAGFALRFGQHMGPYDALLAAGTYHPTGSSGIPVHDLVRSDLERSRAPYIIRHRGDGNAEAYADLPVWVATEVLSFGTLSKCIEYTVNANVAKTMATDFSINHQGFSSQVRSFVSLRSACAHLSRLWNDVSKNPPSVPNNILRRAKKNSGNFHHQSYYHVFVALDQFVQGIDAHSRFLGQVDALLKQDQAFRGGILVPRPY